MQGPGGDVLGTTHGAEDRIKLGSDEGSGSVSLDLFLVGVNDDNLEDAGFWNRRWHNTRPL